MKSKVNWGIIGTGAIAKTFACAVRGSRTGRLVAIASRSGQVAGAFATEFNADRAHGGYEAILNDPDVQAVYIATPHPFHAEWAIKAARARKHVLVEKPIALNHPDATAVVEAAIENNVLLMEALMYRCHAQTARLVELIRGGVIGEVRVIQATFSFHGNFNPDSRLFNNALGGGGILDVGCYTISMARLIAGAAMGKDFADPIEVKGVGHLCQSGVDEWAIASVRFPGDIVAQLSTGLGVEQENVVRIFGTEGRIIVPNPWVADRTEPEDGQIVLRRTGDQQPTMIRVPAEATSFRHEADLVGQAILRGATQVPEMSWDDSLGNMLALDAWRDAIGLVYDSEKPQGYRRTTIGGDVMRVREKHNMKYGRIDGLDKPVSRLVMGCDNQRSFAHAAVMFDDFFERGGNCFDTAFVYGWGLREQLLGQWMKHRGVRQQVVVIVKGAHTPFCTPDGITQQLRISLENLGTDHADIYLMHRDNPQVPVGEFVDVLNEHVRAGRIVVFGGSNWALSRVDQANAYAKQTGKKPFSVVSNQFSLARMVGDPWGGCVSSSDAESRAWFTRTRMPLLPWSSQARGFFLEGTAHPDKRDDKELLRCWYADDNFRRLDRAKELAGKYAVRPVNIALAYVLCQPFPTFALIGPRQLSETRTSLPALDLALTADELKWLNLENCAT